MNEVGTRRLTLQLATFSPPPVKFAKGSSSSKKSGGGDLRGRERGGDEGIVDEWTCPSTIFSSGVMFIFFEWSISHLGSSSLSSSWNPLSN